MLPMLLFACVPDDCTAGTCADSDDTAYEPPPCDGLTIDASGGPVTQLCGTCEGGTCAWDLATDATVTGLELELHGDLEIDDAYAEYHDGFAVDGAVWHLGLTLVTDPGQQASNASTLLDVRDAALLALFTLQVSALAADDGYADCLVWGPDPDSFDGECRLVE